MKRYNVAEFGAIGNGIATDTVPVQTAIDTCAAEGGGRVVVPRGTYRIGTLWLKSHTELHLEKGAVLLGSPNLADYNDDDAFVQNAKSPGEGWSGKHLIIALEAEDVAITGEGTVDGNGQAFLNPNMQNDRDHSHDIAYRLGYINIENRSSMTRPGQELAFFECRGIRIEGVTLRNMAMWTCFLYGCDDISISRVTIRNDLRFANTDGFDIDACRNVTITGCDIETADDGFAIRCCPKRLKSKRGVCENIRISDCKVRTECEVLRIGVGDGLVRNVRISGITVTDASRGFVLQNVYPETNYSGLSMEDIVISDCAIAKSVQAILITSGTPNTEAYIRDVTFENISAGLEGCVMINGLGKARPANILFRNLKLTALAGPYNPTADWECGPMESALENLIRVEHADNVTFDNLEIANAEECGRDGLTAVDSDVVILNP